MKKKFAAMFMAAAMVFTMAACGQKADTPSTPDADGSGDQSGAEVQTFVLGSCGPLTGSAAIYGQAVGQRRGARRRGDQRQRLHRQVHLPQAGR